MNDTKNDIAWNQLFDKYDILNKIHDKGSFEITSSQINQIREARLMTKFDHKANLPKVFRDNNLSILPVTRGSYIISQFEAYKDLEDLHPKINRASFPEFLESIDIENINSEAIAINCAYVSGIIADFIQDDDLLPTVSGRMSSNSFSFNIRNIALNRNVIIDVSNAQVEIDGGYEGLRTLTLIEAKNSISDDFLIRQLYYPYRLLSETVTKQIKSIFMVYSNGIFSLYDYVFEDPLNYNSLALANQKNYSIEPVEITLNDILQLLQRTVILPEPEISFPQADSFKRVINLCELLYNNELSRDDITANYDFDPRQTNYYTDAARYLGLVNKKRVDGNVTFCLTVEGQHLFSLKYKARQLKYVELILRHQAFYDTLKLCLNRGEMPSKTEIIDIMKASKLYRIESESTYIRRASTITGWVNWILDLQR